jgi:hypothetical protein
MNKNLYAINDGKLTPFEVNGVAYTFRKRFVKNVDNGNILDIQQNGIHIGATSIDMPYILRKEAREFIVRMENCHCDNCKKRKRRQ